MTLQKYRRSTTDRKLAGIFGGLGDSLKIDPTYLRLGFLLLAIVTGVIPCLIAYAIAWAITLDGPTDGSASLDDSKDNGPI